MKPKLFIILALLAGAVATYGAYQYMQKEKDVTDIPVISTKTVVVASQDLSIGAALKEDNLKMAEWPQDILPAGSYSTIEELIDRVIKTELRADEPILDYKLAPVGSASGFSAIIPPGMRAVTVAVNVVIGVSGFILPNTRVDILATMSPSVKKEDTSTKTILENVKVLAVDQTFEQEDDDPITVQSVTLLVTPEEAEKLALATDAGKLQLTLRNGADNSMAATSGIKLKELLGQEQAPKPKKVVRQAQPRRVKVEKAPLPDPEPVAKEVEVIRSNKRETITFEEESDKSKSTK